MLKHHAHPVSVHIPNGVLPVSVVFLFLSAMFNIAGLSQAAFYNMLVVVLAMPFVLFSGLSNGRKNTAETGPVFLCSKSHSPVPSP